MVNEVRIDRGTRWVRGDWSAAFSRRPFLRYEQYPYRLGGGKGRFECGRLRACPCGRCPRWRGRSSRKASRGWGRWLFWAGSTVACVCVLPVIIYYSRCSLMFSNIALYCMTITSRYCAEHRATSMSICELQHSALHAIILLYNLHCVAAVCKL